MKENPIRIGGVPEHFNLPIHLAIENGEFVSKGIHVTWINYTGGTGEMIAALRNNEVDVCILLTECIVADIIKGNPCKIISEYVTTPLCWGIHTSTKNELEHYPQIFNKKYAISRLGSGSHLMAIVDAHNKGHKLNESQFTIVKNLDGALESLTNLETDVFYWEKFTTKPFVDSKQLKRIGESYTPWPCFVIAASNKMIEEQPENLISLLKIIHDSCDKFMQNEDVIDLVCNRYKQKKQDVEAWYHATEWAYHGWVSDKMLKSVIYNLQISKIIDVGQAIPELIWKRQKKE